MAYILDPDKNTVGNNLIPDGDPPDTVLTSCIDMKVVGNFSISGGIQYAYKELIDTATNYNITYDDHNIEVISDTYETITLPDALGKQGTTFMIYRNSDNNNLKIVTQLGQTIDTSLECRIRKKGFKITVMSDSENWIIV